MLVGSTYCVAVIKFLADELDNYGLQSLLDYYWLSSEYLHSELLAVE